MTIGTNSPTTEALLERARHVERISDGDGSLRITLDVPEEDDRFEPDCHRTLELPEGPLRDYTCQRFRARHIGLFLQDVEPEDTRPALAVWASEVGLLTQWGTPTNDETEADV